MIAGLSGCNHPPAQPGPTVWSPEQGATWQWQLTGELDLSVEADVFEVDGFDVTAQQVAQLHARGTRVICYLSVGAFEDWRPDAHRFPDEVLGRSNGWDGERWLDIRATDVLLPIMADRMAMCAAKGFDAVEPDNVDGFQAVTGFPLTAADQSAYLRAIADMAHDHGLGVALKNNLDQVAELEPHFDFAVNERCFEFGECHRLEPFLDAGKAVLHAEYQGDLDDFCPYVPEGFSSIRKERDLGPWLLSCPQ